MTTIAVRNGVMAVDSCETNENEDESVGWTQNSCEKMFLVGTSIVGLQGDSTAGMVFLSWFSKLEFQPNIESPRDVFLANDADFTAVVLEKDGTLWEYDKWCHAILVTSEYYAVGSGAKTALGAMFNGADAENAVLAACKHDPYTRGPVKTMRHEK